MASEIIYAEVKVKKASPPAEVTAHPAKSTPQKHNQWLPWLIAALLLLLAVSLLIALIVAQAGLRTNESCEEYEMVRQYLKKRNCVEGSQGKEQVWRCCPLGWEPFQASCYFFSNDTMTWDHSERNCTEMGSHLVVITTGAEQDFIFTWVNGTVTGTETKNYCIGLTDRENKNQWRWVDQTPYNYTAAFWRPGEPSPQNFEECTVMHVPGEQNAHGNRNWNNIPCTITCYRICETAALGF
ncbi:C-type lectin domain family 4 member A-like [Carettochelys insculpta]|uniref:C-type lectin domain family 4 member A-like n=1 Tax=Carettochelys insculpta TaxID=44489 RepID=UPI003EB713D8